jgi:hypothetical protein
MDVEFKKEQNGTLFFRHVGALEGKFWGGRSLRGVHPKKYTCLQKKTPAAVVKNSVRQLLKTCAQQAIFTWSQPMLP